MYIWRFGISLSSSIAGTIDGTGTIDENLVESQLNLIKENEAQYKNIPHPIYSLNEGEGDVVRRTLTTLILQNIV